MLHRIKAKRFFITAIILSFAAHFMICLVLRGYKNERCPLSFAFQSGNYGLGATPEHGFAEEYDDGRIQVQLISQSISTPSTKHTTHTHQEQPTQHPQTLSATNENHSTPTADTPLESAETFLAINEPSNDSSLEILGQAETLANQSQFKSLTHLPTTAQTSNNPAPANKISKSPANSTVANNYHNENLDPSNQPGPSLAGGRANKSASAIRNPYPPYPTSARREGLEGEVIVAIDVSETGRINNVEVTKSSGHTILDQEVLKTIRKHWRFTPAQCKGTPVACKEELVFRFVLDQK